MSRETYEMRSDNTIKIALMSCMHSGGQEHAIEMTKLLKEHFFLFLEQHAGQKQLKNLLLLFLSLTLLKNDTH